MNAPTPDPVIDEIREVRSQISARFGHDPRRLVAHYLKREQPTSSPAASNPTGESIPGAGGTNPTAPGGESDSGRISSAPQTR
jgi:hypothetical protein